MPPRETAVIDRIQPSRQELNAPFGVAYEYYTSIEALQQARIVAAKYYIGFWLHIEECFNSHLKVVYDGIRIHPVTSRCKEKLSEVNEHVRNLNLP